MLRLDELVHLAKGDVGEGDRHLSKEQAQINGITHHGMRRELTPLQVRPKPVDSRLEDIVHGLSPLEPLALFDLRHGLVVLRPFGPVIELCIAEGGLDGAVPHQFFDDLE